jgi:site-specific DNA recombinase
MTDNRKRHRKGSAQAGASAKATIKKDAINLFACGHCGAQPASYGRLSTTDKQDPALSFPSQRKACERKVGELGGEITCEFTDQESGAKQERPGWSALTHEARDREGRRFDAVVMYSTSRLARDRLYAALFERELSKVGVAIHYATGAGDPDTPEGKVFIGMQQLWDEFERNKLARETKRGMREGTEQGYRMGGRPPYGYRREAEGLPDDHRGDRSKTRVRLVPDPAEAEVVAEIFHFHAVRGLSPKAIADRLNKRGLPAPNHVDRGRNRNGHWAGSTIRMMLKNEVYTGKAIWNRLDFTEAKHSGGGSRPRAREEWVVCEDAHLPLVSEELFARSQARFQHRPRRQAANGGGGYLFAGMVHCATGHGPLSMQGKARKGHNYYACPYGENYGDAAAIDSHAGCKWIYVRESVIEPFVMAFFAKRIFGPMRVEKLAKQLRAHGRSRKRDQRHLATRLRKQIAEAERKIKVQVQALEDGIEPEIVTARIAELRADKDAAHAALAGMDIQEIEGEEEDLSERLKRIPDLAEQLHDAPPALKRQVFDAFELRIDYDKAERRIEISATVSEAVAEVLETEKTLLAEGLPVTVRDIAGAGFEPATSGL